MRIALFRPENRETRAARWCAIDVRLVCGWCAGTDVDRCPVLVTDLVMPDTTGDEVAQHRNAERGSRTGLGGGSESFVRLGGVAEAEPVDQPIERAPTHPKSHGRVRLVAAAGVEGGDDGRALDLA